MKITLKTILAAAAVSAVVSLKAEDITYPADSTLTFSGGTSYTESGDEWGVSHSTPLAVSITGTGNTLDGINKEANPWRNITLTGDGYLTMRRDAQWSIGFSGTTKDFNGTLHIQHVGYNQTYFGIDAANRSLENASIVLEAGSGNSVYFSEYASQRKVGDLSTTGDNPTRITVRKKNNGTLYIGSLGKNSTFGGRFENEGTTPFDLVKVGAGTWTLDGEVAITSGTFTVQAGAVSFDCNVACAVSVGATGSIGGSGTINGAVTATSGAKLLFASDKVLTFTDAANLNGFTVDATGCTAENEYLVAKGTTSLPGVSAAQTALGWMTEAKNGNVYLVNRMTVFDSNVTLDSDSDWTATPVTVADNVTIDLNGHDLYIAGITLGEGVAFVNSGANARVYIGINGADKTWALGVAFPSTVMPVFCGAAIEIPATYIPEGGIGFKDTVGTQLVYQKSCNNGLAFLGSANLKEPWKDWNFGQGKACTVTVEGEANVFAFDNDNGGTIPSAFTTTPFVGDGHLTIVSAASSSVTPTVGDKSADDSAFSGTIALRNANSANKTRGFGIRFEDDNDKTKALVNGTLALSCDDDVNSQFSLLSGNYSTPPTYNLGNLVTEGEHPERVILNSRMNAVGMSATLKVGWNNEDGVFAGTITNVVGNDSYPIAIEKHGTGTWKLSGNIANGGTFNVVAGCVEFRGGIDNVSSLAVASGASVLFAGDMGANPISLASGSTLKLDASNEGEDVPVVNGDLDLTGVNVYVSQGTYVPSKTTPRELLRVTGTLTGFDRDAIDSDIDAPAWAFRLLTNEDGSKSLVHGRKPGFAVFFR